MHKQPIAVSGHLKTIERQRGPVFYAKIRRPIRLPNGDVVSKQTHERLGPLWKGTGRPPEGFYTKRTAEVALQDRLAELRRSAGETIADGSVTFREAAEAWFTHGETERGWKPSTRRDYRSALDRHLLPAFGDQRLVDIDTQAIERWRSKGLATKKLRRRTAVKLTAMLHGIFARARRPYGLKANPVDDVEPLRLVYDTADFVFYTPEEVWALVREAEHPTKSDDEDEAPRGSAQDAAIYLTAAFTGLRLGELLALRVRDVDFAADSLRVMGSVDIVEGVGTPKSGKGRSVPMVDDVAKALAKLLQREHFTGPDDFVFVGEAGGHLDGSALRRRYRDTQARAKLSPIRFHDLRHTFGSLAVASPEFGILDVQTFLGHADSRTTARYVHYRQRKDEAERLSRAFKLTPDHAQATASEAAKIEPDRPAG